MNPFYKKEVSIMGIGAMLLSIVSLFLVCSVIFLFLKLIKHIFIYLLILFFLGLFGVWILQLSSQHSIVGLILAILLSVALIIYIVRCIQTFVKVIHEKIAKRNFKRDFIKAQEKGKCIVSENGNNFFKL